MTERTPAAPVLPTDSTLPERTRQRTYHWGDPLIGAQAARHLSGLEYLRAMARGEFTGPPVMDTLEFSLAMDDIEDGRVTFRMTPQAFHYNPIGSVHGGVYAAVLDSALGCAIHTRLPVGVGYTTLELKVSYLRPLLVGMGEVRAIGEVLSLSKQVATAQARLVDAQDKLFAHATTTCLLLRPT